MRAHRIKSTMRVYHVFNPHTAKEPISPFLASDWSMFVNLSVTKATRGRTIFIRVGTGVMMTRMAAFPRVQDRPWIYLLELI